MGIVGDGDGDVDDDAVDVDLVGSGGLVVDVVIIVVDGFVGSL